MKRKTADKSRHLFLANLSNDSFLSWIVFSSEGEKNRYRQRGRKRGLVSPKNKGRLKKIASFRLTWVEIHHQESQISLSTFYHMHTLCMTKNKVKGTFVSFLSIHDSWLIHWTETWREPDKRKKGLRDKSLLWWCWKTFIPAKEKLRVTNRQKESRRMNNSEADTIIQRPSVEWI